MAGIRTVTRNRQLVVGKTLVVVGCLWFLLVLFRIPPLFVALFMSLTWLGPRAAGFDEILTIVAGREYIMAVATVSLGVLVWRRAIIRRWPLRLIYVALALSIIGGGTWYGLKAQTQGRREAAYQMTLHSYDQVLKPGTTRGELEGYLGARNTPFERMCCVDAARLSERASWDDLVKIGQEKPPWFCSENYIYVAFQFIDHVPPTVSAKTADDLDTLKSVSIYRQLGGCL
jgi:hypothetical protein